ncbi:GntR family transcriptional regulator [Mycobacteroides abscessus]|uniref:GntR family transcriptional regulator n=1 Tax=Mycobacteroides abscessus TaxID=36809 RepID=UPI00092942FE|nr:GntR family transcriptional regulator [Mycobacteroides abscessus]SIG01664.1 UbiC transcription regulator-associated domain-containing protein [Mycobacteroides abscessus subsp. abscessus]SKW94849.1 UbiC transcription regulator-associated domain-containing protein [Mycobacteroides abscessus subsp. abscessus]SKY35956.1 UbiC transcription regulator-associated domain-containing protein [Mycobacteroides abscessus subsp. abscessus]SKZ33364.1 UbiC transcription regulator-associated domain-containing
MTSPVDGAEPEQATPRMPVYLAVAETLAAKISGMHVGTRLPAEDKLARELGVSRLTARAALAELESRYLVIRRQGSGTFVSRRIDYTISRHDPPSWSASVRSAGRTPTIRTTAWGLDKPPAEIRHRMRIGARRQLLALSRNRYVDDELAGFADTWLDPELVPDLPRALDPAASLHDVLDRHYRLEPVRGWFGVAIDPAPPEVTHRLGLSGHPPAIAIRSRTDAAARDHRPVELTISWLRADIFRVEIDFDTRP